MFSTQVSYFNLSLKLSCNLSDFTFFFFRNSIFRINAGLLTKTEETLSGWSWACGPPEEAPLLAPQHPEKSLAIPVDTATKGLRLASCFVTARPSPAIPHPRVCGRVAGCVASVPMSPAHALKIVYQPGIQDPGYVHTYTFVFFLRVSYLVFQCGQTRAVVVIASWCICSTLFDSEQ